MSNAINRQEVSDYEKQLAAWRKLAEGYGGQVDQYNANAQASADAYNAQINTFNASVNAYNTTLNDSPRIVGGSAATGWVLSDGQKLKGGLSGHPGAYLTGYEEIGYGNEDGGVDLISVPTFSDLPPGLSRPDISSVGPVPTKAPEPVAPPDRRKPVAPSLTIQQTKDITKSDQPLADTALSEASKRSVFKPEQGLIARAMAGFKD